MLRSSIRNSRYRQLRAELAQPPIGTPFSREAQNRHRKANLVQVVNLGTKAEGAKEILDIFMDGTEDLVLEAMKNADTPERLAEIRAYYKACLALEKEFDSLIAEALIKQKALDGLNQRKGEK